MLQKNLANVVLKRWGSLVICLKQNKTCRIEQSVARTVNNNERHIMSTQIATSQYMLLFRGTHWDKNLSPEQIQNVMNRWMAWYDRLVREEKIKSAHPLVNEGKIVSKKKGLAVADGPFAESKEAIGGYFLLLVNDLDEALEIAKECPTLDYGSTVEVRPVAEQCPHLKIQFAGAATA
jgi:hypothetical protein